MLPTTIDATRALLKADHSLTPADRSRIISMLRNHGKKRGVEDAPKKREPRLIRRAEVASRLGCSLRTVDSWAHSGILRKVVLPGRIRAAGFLESDIAAIIEQREASR